MDRKNSILIIDDSEVSIMALKDILEPDYTVFTAKNGKIGMEEAEKQLPDIILLDIIMPEIDGYTVLATLKKNEKTKGIPVMLISSLDDMRNEQKGFILGAADYVSKPFSPTVVKHRVQNQIDVVNLLYIKDQSNIKERLQLRKELDEALQREAELQKTVKDLQDKLSELS